MFILKVEEVKCCDGLYISSIGHDPSFIIACEGGASGSVVGSSERCQWGGSEGVCDGQIKKLSGTFTVDIEDDDIFSGDIINVEAVVSVEGGVIDVSVESPDGRITSLQVLPNRPGTLVGHAEGDFSAFEVTPRRLFSL